MRRTRYERAIACAAGTASIQRVVLVLFVAQGLIGIPVFLVLLLGLGCLERARPCGRARNTRRWHADSASDRQLGAPGRIGCLDGVRAPVAGLRNAGRGPPASVTPRCVSMAGTLGAGVGAAWPGVAVLAGPARCNGGARLEPAPAWCTALRHPTRGGAAGARADECYAVSARNSSTAVTRRSTEGC